MSDCFPLRVILLHENGGDSGWRHCAAAGADRSSDMSNVHCHLFGANVMQHSTAGLGCKRHQHMSTDEQINGKTRGHRFSRRLLMDGGKPCDSVQTVTNITCTYGIPSSIECLDLAASCLQRISGSYCMSCKIPCVMSVCACRTQTDMPPSDSASIRKKHTRNQCDVPTACVLESLYSTREALLDDKSRTDDETEPQQQQPSRCTRSSSKQQLVDNSIVSSSVRQSKCVGAASSKDRDKRSKRHIMAVTKTRINRAAAIAAAAAIRSCESEHRRPQPKQDDDDKQTQACQLRSQQAQAAKSKPSRRSPRRHQQTGCSEATADCEVLVNRLTAHASCSRPATSQRSASDFRRRDHDGETASTSVAESTPVTNSSRTESAHCEQQESVCREQESKCREQPTAAEALSVDTDLDRCYNDDICQSPTSPLPVSSKMTSGSAAHLSCTSVLQQAAACLSARRFVCC